LRRSKLTGERFDRIVAELKQIGLGLPRKITFSEDSSASEVEASSRRSSAAANLYLL
jgi:hypothetical protein